jgi:hypothetical protein
MRQSSISYCYPTGWLLAVHSPRMHGPEGFALLRKDCTARRRGAADGCRVMCSSAAPNHLNSVGSEPPTWLLSATDLRQWEIVTTVANLAYVMLRAAGWENIAVGLRWASRNYDNPLSLLRVARLRTPTPGLGWGGVSVRSVVGSHLLTGYGQSRRSRSGSIPIAR